MGFGRHRQRASPQMRLIGEALQPADEAVGDPGDPEVLQTEQTADVAGIDLADQPAAVVDEQKMISQDRDVGFEYSRLISLVNSRFALVTWLTSRLPLWLTF